MMNEDEQLAFPTRRAFRLRLPQIHLLSGWAAWGLVAALVLLYFIPYLFESASQLGIYAAAVCLPIIGAALLRTYRGSLLAWGCCFAGLLLLREMEDGQWWSVSIFLNLVLPNLLVLLIGLIVAHLSAVSQQLRQMHHQLAITHQELIVANGLINGLALTDPLTGLPNHRAIMDQIDAELQHCQTTRCDCAIIFVDVDHFKQVNDTWGHSAGDAVLRNIGQRLQANVRREDHVGRYGGEEFAILLANIEQQEAYELAERLRCSIAEETYLWQSQETKSVIPIPLTASFGLAVYPLDGMSREELITMADAAMYHAKQSGRNRVCLPDEENLTPQDTPDSGYLCLDREDGVTQALPRAEQLPDQERQAHALRLLQLAEETTRLLGRSEEEVSLIRLAVQLHDIGKVGIPEAILHKAGPLTQQEWGVMHQHPAISKQILTQAGGRFELVSHIVVAHHERWDGQGYPYGLAQDKIPLGARILSVVDSYDAMTSSRPYREALSEEQAREELVRGEGSQYDPEVVAVFLRVLQERKRPMGRESLHSTHVSL